MNSFIKSILEKKLDRVGNEDGDINNDGKIDSTDNYLLNRRKAISKAMKNESLNKGSRFKNSEDEKEMFYGSGKSKTKSSSTSAKDRALSKAADSAQPKSKVSLKKAPWEMKEDADEMLEVLFALNEEELDFFLESLEEDEIDVVSESLQELQEADMKRLLARDKRRTEKSKTTLKAAPWEKNAGLTTGERQKETAYDKEQARKKKEAEEKAAEQERIRIANSSKKPKKTSDEVKSNIDAIRQAHKAHIEKEKSKVEPTKGKTATAKGSKAGYNQGEVKGHRGKAGANGGQDTRVGMGTTSRRTPDKKYESGRTVRNEEAEIAEQRGGGQKYKSHKGDRIKSTAMKIVMITDPNTGKLKPRKVPVDSNILDNSSKALKKEEVERINEISRDLARSYIRKASAHKNTGEKSDKDRTKGIETAGKKAYGITGKAKVSATEEFEPLDEISRDLAHAVAKKRQAQASDLRQKAVDEPDMMKAFAHTKAANAAEKKAGKSYNRLMNKEEVEMDLDKILSKLTEEELQVLFDVMLEEVEQIDERNAENKLKKDMHAVRLGHQNDPHGDIAPRGGLRKVSRRSSDNSNLRDIVAKYKQSGRAQMKHGGDAGILKNMSNAGKGSVRDRKERRMKEETNSTDALMKAISEAIKKGSKY